MSGSGTHDMIAIIGGITLIFAIIFFIICIISCRSRDNNVNLDTMADQAPPILANSLENVSSDSGGEWVGKECRICLSEFKEGEEVKVLPCCEQYLHSECVDKWLIDHSSCPLCRASLNNGESSFPNILFQQAPITIRIQF